MQSVGNPAEPVYGIAAEFDTAADLYHAAEQLRDAGYEKFDVFSPFPIHGMDQAMGLKRSVLGFFVFFGGLTGFITAVTMQFVPSSFLYPLIVAGKPTNLMTAPAFFPIMFELTVLFSAFTTLIGMFLLNGLPRWNHPLFNWERFKKVSEDKFVAVIESGDPKFSEEEAFEFFSSLGGQNITKVHGD